MAPLHIPWPWARQCVGRWQMWRFGTTRRKKGSMLMPSEATQPNTITLVGFLRRDTKRTGGSWHFRGTRRRSLRQLMSPCKTSSRPFRELPYRHWPDFHAIQEANRHAGNDLLAGQAWFHDDQRFWLAVLTKEIRRKRPRTKCSYPSKVRLHQVLEVRAAELE